MIKYLFSMDHVPGQVVFGFRHGVGMDSSRPPLLVHYDNASQMNEQQLGWMWDKLPRTPQELQAVVQHLKGIGKPCSLKEVPADLSFDAFWNAYQKKVNRKRCEPIWLKMRDGDRMECLLSLPAYDAFLRRHHGRAKLDPENYLKNESWKNVWGSM